MHDDYTVDAMVIEITFLSAIVFALSTLAYLGGLQEAEPVVVWSGLIMMAGGLLMIATLIRR